MEVGIFAASRLDTETDWTVAVGFGVVVKTLRLDRDVQRLQYGHVHPPVLS
jgi:hypothetical protein